MIRASLLVALALPVAAWGQCYPATGQGCAPPVQIWPVTPAEPDEIGAAVDACERHNLAWHLHACANVMRRFKAQLEAAESAEQRARDAADADLVERVGGKP